MSPLATPALLPGSGPCHQLQGDPGVPRATLVGEQGLGWGSGLPTFPVAPYSEAAWESI